MPKTMPPVPPAARTTKGPHGSPEDRTDEAAGQRSDKQSEKNLAHQGRPGNIRQNTTHQGYQQDR